jgi:hypothetical protein
VFEKIHHHQPHADGNTGISHIEGWPMVIFVIKVQKVDHFPVQYAVNHVTNSPAENQYQPTLGHSLTVGRMSKEAQYGNDRNSRDENKKHGLVLRGKPGEHAKSHTRIANMGQIKKTINHFDGIELGNVGGDKIFAELIENDHPIGNQQKM